MSRSEAANDRMLLRAYLRRSGGSATVDEARQSCTRPNDRLWSSARIKRAILWDEMNPDRRALIKFVQGGGGLRLVENDERVGLGRGAKGEVIRGITGESRFVLKTFGTADQIALNVRVIETGKRAGPEHGSNARPDIVVGAYLNESMRRPILHNIEFQGKNTSGRNTFTSSDIAQAFTCGRGADYSWVMIHKSARLFKTNNNYEQWERALWFAGCVGIGVILYDDPRQVLTWDLVLGAKKRARDSIHSRNYAGWFFRLNDEDHYPPE